MMMMMMMMMCQTRTRRNSRKNSKHNMFLFEPETVRVMFFHVLCTAVDDIEPID